MTVTVLDTTPPTVSLASLPPSVSGTQVLTANASDTQSGIASVQFLVDGQPLATVTAAPYTFSWNTTSVSNIQHTLTAIAKDGAGKTAASAPVTVTVENTTAVATHLVVTTPPPTSVTAGVPFSLVVTAENGSGNTDTTYTGPVTLALSGGTSGAKLGGTVTGTAVNGVAAFTGLTIDTAGTGYILTASSGTLTSATIPGINVAAATVTATKLVVTTPPANVTANAPFGLSVTAEDGSGNIATTYTGPVTLALSGGTSGAVLGGTVTGTAVNGVAAFTGLTINTAGTGYTLTASSSTLTSATSSINVTATVTATKLVDTTTPPASVAANAPFGLTVTAEDGSGNIATTYTGPVTLALSGGTSGAVLGGTVTGTAVNGVAAFTGLTINTVGTGYTLTASSRTLTSATSSINVAAATAAPSVTGITPHQRPRRGRHRGDDHRNQLHRRHGGAVWCRERHELHRRLDWHCDHCRQPSRYRRHLCGHHRHHAGRYVAPRRGGHVPVRLPSGHRGAECNRPQPHQRPRRGRHRGDDHRNQLHRRHGGAVWCRERHELHRRLDWHCDHCRQPSRYRRHLCGHHRHHAGRYVAPQRGGHVPVRRRDHRGAECNRPQPHQRPRRGRHRGDDLRNQLHRCHGGAVWYRERHELHRRLDWHCDHCRQPSRYRRHLCGHHRHHAGRYVARQRGGHVPVRVT